MQGHNTRVKRLRGTQNKQLRRHKHIHTHCDENATVPSTECSFELVCKCRYLCPDAEGRCETLSDACARCQRITESNQTGWLFGVVKSCDSDEIWCAVLMNQRRKHSTHPHTQHSTHQKAHTRKMCNFQTARDTRVLGSVDRSRRQHTQSHTRARNSLTTNDKI